MSVFKRASNDRVLEIFERSGAILEDDHFVYGNGDHGSGWVAKDNILPFPNLIDELASLLANEVRLMGAEVICAPAIGGMVIAQWTARHLGIPAVFAEREVTAENACKLHKPFKLKRGFEDWITDRRVLLIDDAVSTGYSVMETAKCLGKAREVVGVAALITRGNVSSTELNVPRFAYLAEIDIPSWPESTCPAEIMARPVNVRFAHGAEYVAMRNSDGCTESLTSLSSPDTRHH